MQVLRFTPHQEITLFDTRHIVDSVTNNREIKLKRLDDERVSRVFDIETLLAHHRAGNLRAAPPRDKGRPQRERSVIVARRLACDLSEHAKKVGFARRALLSVVKRHGGDPLRMTQELRQELQVVAKEHQYPRVPCLGTLRRWLRREYRAGDDPCVLIPYWERRGGRGRPRVPHEAEQAVAAAIDNRYLTAGRLSGKRAYEHCKAQLAQRNAYAPADQQQRIPSYSTFLRRIHSRPGFEVCAAREGIKAARLRFRQSNPTSELHRFNACWEVDHTTLDIFVVDPKTGLVLGRPRLTLIIEYVTRAIMGFDLGFSGSSAQAVLNALKHAASAKTYIKERFPLVKGTWPCFGLPLVLKCDNGSEFHSDSLRDACFELGIELQYCPPHRPWFKGRVERAFREINENGLAGLPGHIAYQSKGSKGDEIALASSNAVLDLEHVEHLLHVWMVDVYMQRPHRGLHDGHDGEEDPLLGDASSDQENP